MSNLWTLSSVSVSVWCKMGTNYTCSRPGVKEGGGGARLSILHPPSQHMGNSSLKVNCHKESGKTVSNYILVRQHERTTEFNQSKQVLTGVKLVHNTPDIHGLGHNYVELPFTFKYSNGCCTVGLGHCNGVKMCAVIDKNPVWKQQERRANSVSQF